VRRCCLVSSRLTHAFLVWTERRHQAILVFAAAWTYDPAPLAQDLTTLRFALVKAGHDVRAFHATKDRQINRNAVVELLARYPGRAFAAVVIEKVKVYPDLRPPHRFYSEFASSVLKYICHRHVRDHGAYMARSGVLQIGSPGWTRTSDILINRRGPVMNRPSRLHAHFRVTARHASTFVR